ncbi:hypothetical protein TRAPUB_8991 [Trametes pubescens]|uniref:Uncharacterized protein n=1 Tax=Trametes pubescens TaxID=154538 RepID=A0A1M2W3M8_TRAPU|nr:hypothetical protein TRAPUB_8991 [Trametes pubescens]
MATADPIVVRSREVPVSFLYTSFHVMSPALERLPWRIQDPARTPGNPVKPPLPGGRVGVYCDKLRRRRCTYCLVLE